jgi:hypothetical protein
LVQTIPEIRNGSFSLCGMSVMIQENPPTGCASCIAYGKVACQCSLPAAPADKIEVFVHKTPAGVGVFAIRGRSFVLANQLTASWRMGCASAPFYARVQPGKVLSHAIYLLPNRLPAGMAPGLSPDGYGILEFLPGDVEEKLMSLPVNTRVKLY